MRKIRVLHLTSTPRGIGGVERLLLDMARHYDRDQFEVSHCNLFDESGGTGPFPTALKVTGLHYFEIAGGGWRDVPSMVRELHALIRKEGIDVLHLHMVHATIVGGIATLLRSCARVLVSKHYRYAMLRGALPRLLDRAFTNRADMVAPVSEYVREDLLRHGTNRAKIRVIHNGIDLELFDRGSAEEPATILSDGSGPWLACFGSLHPLKGHEFAVRAMPEIVRNHPTAKLLIVGEGAERGRLEELSSSLGVEHAVLMPGFQPNVPAVLPHVDLCIHPSVDEAFGLVLLEAMAARRPIVASEVGGISEIVADGVSGLLIIPRSPDAIANAVSVLLKDPASAVRMGEAGRTRVEREFTILKTVRSYEKLYGEMMDADSAAPAWQAT